MNTVIAGLRKVLGTAWLKWLALPAAVVAVVGTVMSQSAPPSTPLITLASEPLYARGARAKPTLTLALSVEFPTVGSQYTDTYTSANQYIGYFDSESCYIYNDAPASSDVASDGTPGKRFDRSGSAQANHSCGGTAFSGNLMNWATSSAIDILRYGLTGGDRIVDTQTLTVLQRAVLPTSFYNSGNFLDKQVSSSDAASGLPSTLLGSYTAGTVHIANCLNRIHFGKSATGNCATPGDNASLGSTVPAATMGPVASSTTLPAGAVSCASENGTCSFTGIAQVWYGATGHWNYASANNGISCSNGVFGDPISGTVKACYKVTPDPTGWSPGGSTGSVTSDGFFYARVSVCASNGSGVLQDPRSNLCLRYPNGQYKPVGNLQKYSDRLRVAAFGYLNDSTGNPNERYGGVLRAPMKYVGSTYYDSNFALVSGTNPNQEWDPTSGIFLANPDGNTAIRSGPTNAGPYLSGVVNYLNQFGRTGTAGLYKTYDPVGELYYESLRYLQGLPPTPQATYGMNTSMQDGYPVTTSWSDPHPAVSGMTDYSCVRNNIVGIGDVNTHNDKSLPGNTTRLTNEDAVNLGFPSGRAANLAANEPDFYQWTHVAGGFEANGGVSYLDGQGRSQTTSNFAPTYGGALLPLETFDIGADRSAYFLVGAAYWANTHDIRGANWTSWSGTDPRRPGMRVTTYFLDVNEYGAQSNAFTRHYNQFYLASKYGGFTDVTGTGNPFKAIDGTNTDDNWQDPSAPGEPKTYFLSSSATRVLAALDQIFAQIAEQANSIAGGAVSTQRLSSTANFIYQAQFDPASWAGDLQAYTATADGAGNVTIAATSTWQAANELDAKGASGRNIVIGKTVASSSATATPFLWANVDADVKAALVTPPYSAASAPADPTSTGQARLDFLRGDRSNEAPNNLRFRKRAHVLGDIVNSAVAYSGPPSGDIQDASYASFKSSYAGRKRALFVGANDGMLHAFDPDHGTISSHPGGDELFAYIPSTMIPKLGALSSTSYVHASYVDGSPVVAEAKVGASMSSGTWKTVLLGATGGGSQSVFALDVSDPAVFDASKVMWEFTDKDDPELGNVIGHPQILKIRTTATNAAADYQYFAVFASGVNNYAADGSFSTTGNPAIFLLDLSKAAGTAWTLGTNYYKIAFPATTSSASGMIGFSARLGTADALSTLYAGDLQGNLWKLDFAQATNGKGDWNLSSVNAQRVSSSYATLNKLSYFKSSGGTAVPMYIAKSSAGVLQPITMDPALVFTANRQLIVSFGTGKFLETSDNVRAGAPQQSIYAILDNNTTTFDGGSSASVITGRTRLAAGSLSGGAISVPAFTWGRSLADSDSTGLRSGWYYDFGTAGERQISDFAVLLGQLVFGSVIPGLNSCDNGSGNVYVTDLATGASTVSVSNVGILGQPYVSQVNSASSTQNSGTGVAQQTTQYQVILQGSGGIAKTGSLKTANAFVGRLSWRELSNYQQVRNNP